MAPDVEITGRCVAETWEAAVVFSKRAGNWNGDLMLKVVEEAKRGRGELPDRCNGEKNVVW